VRTCFHSVVLLLALGSAAAIAGERITIASPLIIAPAVPRTFVGLDADVSLLSADPAHRVEVELPPLAGGQFQGMFLESVESEYTTSIEAVK
jgi:hypothetical protein